MSATLTIPRDGAEPDSGGCTRLPSSAEVVDTTPTCPTVDVAVPVYNEVHVLAESIHRLAQHMANLPFSWRITIVDNASVDGTWDLAAHLAATQPGVRAVRLEQKGRGRALRTAWTWSDAEVVAYTDVDLSTGLDALLPLVAPLISGHSDVAIGTRLARSSRVTRGAKREFISRSYNLLVRTLGRASFSDAQCGFKAVRTDTARRLLALVENDNWFFDTELLLASQHNGLRIHEVPVDWVDDPDSRVDIIATAREDLAGLARVTRRIVAGEFSLDRNATTNPDDHLGRQAVMFAAVGAATTVLHLTLFALWHRTLGAQFANAAALSVATIVNTFANGRLAFNRRGGRWLGPQLQAGSIFLAGLAFTSTAILALSSAWPEAPTVVAMLVLVGANAAVTFVRFVAMRRWIFRADTSIPQWRPVGQETKR